MLPHGYDLFVSWSENQMNQQFGIFRLTELIGVIPISLETVCFDGAENI